MRVAILESRGHLDKRLQRLLTQHGVKGDIVSSITRRVVEEYGLLVLSSYHEIPNLPVRIEQLVLEDAIHILYINKTAATGPFYNILHDMRFHMIQEWTLDVELPLLIRTLDKLERPYRDLLRRYEILQDKYDLVVNTNKAKRILMEHGYSEEEAHQFIQKAAMDQRISKKRLVNLIIANKIDF
jgi:hypothetical protein